MRLIATDNLLLASVMRYHDIKLVAIDKSDPKRSIFQFAYSEQGQNIITAFWNNELIVEPRAFFASQKDLKSMLYDHSYA